MTGLGATRVKREVGYETEFAVDSLSLGFGVTYTDPAAKLRGGKAYIKFPLWQIMPAARTDYVDLRLRLDNKLDGQLDGVVDYTLTGGMGGTETGSLKITTVLTPQGWEAKLTTEAGETVPERLIPIFKILAKSDFDNFAEISLDREIGKILFTISRVDQRQLEIGVEVGGRRYDMQAKLDQAGRTAEIVVKTPGKEFSLTGRISETTVSMAANVAGQTYAFDAAFDPTVRTAQVNLKTPVHQHSLTVEMTEDWKLTVTGTMDDKTSTLEVYFDQNLLHTAQQFTQPKGRTGVIFKTPTSQYSLTADFDKTIVITANNAGEVYTMETSVDRSAMTAMVEVTTPSVKHSVTARVTPDWRLTVEADVVGHKHSMAVFMDKPLMQFKQGSAGFVFNVFGQEHTATVAFTEDWTVKIDTNIVGQVYKFEANFDRQLINMKAGSVGFVLTCPQSKVYAVTGKVTENMEVTIKANLAGDVYKVDANLDRNLLDMKAGDVSVVFTCPQSGVYSVTGKMTKDMKVTITTNFAGTVYGLEGNYDGPARTARGVFKTPTGEHSVTGKLTDKSVSVEAIVAGKAHKVILTFDKMEMSAGFVFKTPTQDHSLTGKITKDKVWMVSVAGDVKGAVDFVMMIRKDYKEAKLEATHNGVKLIQMKLKGTLTEEKTALKAKFALMDSKFATGTLDASFGNGVFHITVRPKDMPVMDLTVTFIPVFTADKFTSIKLGCHAKKGQETIIKHVLEINNGMTPVKFDAKVSTEIEMSKNFVFYEQFCQMGDMISTGCFKVKKIDTFITFDRTEMKEISAGYKDVTDGQVCCDFSVQLMKGPSHIKLVTPHLIPHINTDTFTLSTVVNHGVEYTITSSYHNIVLSVKHEKTEMGRKFIIEISKNGEMYLTHFLEVINQNNKKEFTVGATSEVEIAEDTFLHAQLCRVGGCFTKRRAEVVVSGGVDRLNMRPVFRKFTVDMSATENDEKLFGLNVNTKETPQQFKFFLHEKVKTFYSKIVSRFNAIVLWFRLSKRCSGPPTNRTRNRILVLTYNLNPRKYSIDIMLCRSSR